MATRNYYAYLVCLVKYYIITILYKSYWNIRDQITIEKNKTKKVRVQL